MSCPGIFFETHAQYNELLIKNKITVAMCDTASLSSVGMLAASSGVSVAMSTDGVGG